MIGTRSLSDEEITALANSMNMRDRAVFMLGIRTGFRIAELVSLNVIDVFDGRHVRASVKVSKCRMKGKTESRTMPIHEDAKWAIANYLRDYPVRNLSYPLFRTNPVKRMHTKTFRNALKAACAKCNIDEARVSTHALRKTFANKMNKALDNDIYALQKAMGHKSINSTAKYIEVDEQHVWNLIKNMK